jgi:hypothetical protein
VPEGVHVSREPAVVSRDRERYSRIMLAACPFCRELSDTREEKACAVCGVRLVPLAKLRPTAEALSEDGTPTAPESETLPWTYLGRGRGPLVALALLGLIAFGLPWVKLTLPDLVTYSGIELARRLGWVWGAGVAWIVLVPTVASRRSIIRMRGARFVASILASVPGLTAALLFLRPPHPAHYIPLRFSFGAGIFATLVFSALAVGAALVLGGRADDIRVKSGSSRGQVVH